MKITPTPNIKDISQQTINIKRGDIIKFIKELGFSYKEVTPEMNPNGLDGMIGVKFEEKIIYLRYK